MKKLFAMALVGALSLGAVSQNVSGMQPTPVVADKYTTEARAIQAVLQDTSITNADSANTAASNKELKLAFTTIEALRTAFKGKTDDDATLKALVSCLKTIEQTRFGKAKESLGRGVRGMWNHKGKILTGTAALVTTAALIYDRFFDGTPEMDGRLSQMVGYLYNSLPSFSWRSSSETQPVAKLDFSNITPIDETTQPMCGLLDVPIQAVKSAVIEAVNTAPTMINTYTQSLLCWSSASTSLTNLQPGTTYVVDNEALELLKQAGKVFTSTPVTNFLGMNRHGFFTVTIQ